ncbi:hypothetical protein [Aromatoleum evansii]|uniref:hypothetical protein n=1 Tax=Aromatoleum evansii TaxID=59406 RepID=UPI00145F6FF8|nr:hypothetical protein [Aromatoleum evansii]NMG30603.1 hypothetical protein [Aromatoleum evansii]
MTTRAQGAKQENWRKPTAADKQRAKCVARSVFEPGTFEVAWNAEWNCWALHGHRHILTHVSEIRGS